LRNKKVEEELVVLELVLFPDIGIAYLILDFS